MNYILLGNESYFLKKKKKEIINEWIGEFDEMCVEEIDASTKHFNVQQIIDEASTMPFFSEYKILIISNPLFLGSQVSIDEKDAQLLTNYVSKSNPSTILIFYLEDIKVDSRKKVVKELRKNCREFECNKLNEGEFYSFVSAELKNKKISITKDATSELCARLDNSIELFFHELEKLELYSDNITINQIELLVSRPLESKAYEIVNAVVSGDHKKATQCWYDFETTKIDPNMLLTLIGKQFEMMYQVYVLDKKGYSEQSIARELNMHPYPVKLAKQSLRKTSLSSLKLLIDECAKLDQDFKMGKVDRKIGFEVFLLKTTGRMN